MDNRDGHTEDTRYFIGTEVEHTPAYGQKTLFVIGVQNLKEILARALNNNCPHIYLGANQSFHPETEAEWTEWNFVIGGLVSEGIWVTLDYDIKYHEEVLEEGWNEQNNFISMISVKIPYIEALNYNACIKFDDKGFDATNPGVWVRSIHELQSRKGFTDWTKYTKDEIID